MTRYRLDETADDLLCTVTNRCMNDGVKMFREGDPTYYGEAVCDEHRALIKIVPDRSAP